MLTASADTPDQRLDVLRAIERRLLWLSTAMIDHANHHRLNPGGVKVGGHQASCASMVTIMTALYFDQLRADDQVSVKPHAGPLLHAANFLLGRLDASYLTRLRELGGLQAYPSRTKDPDPVDYSTGSVGIGATATVWGALARRMLSLRAPTLPVGRQYALVGDAELDEGAVWEAIIDPQVAELGELVWIVDVNRQSLDRVVPGIATDKQRAMFEAAGWQVLTAKYGQVLESLFAREGGAALRARIDAMSNPEYQRLLRCAPDELRHRLPGNGPTIARLLDDVDDATLVAAPRNLGGHDLQTLASSFDAIDDARPTVVFAYTIKGFGLPIEGHPQNHSALLTEQQVAALAPELGADVSAPFAGFAPESDEGRWCARRAGELQRTPRPMTEPPAVPGDLGHTPQGVVTTQAALGRTLFDLAREHPEVAARVITVSPDVSSSTNLAGWINKAGVWSAVERRDWFVDDGETLLHWRERPSGQHIELGIAETNLVGLLSELGATFSRWGEPLYPIGVLYDPFVARALEPWANGIYAGGQSILVGTPSGVSLSSEGGAHQSVLTPSIGIEQPGCVSYEPAFAIEVEWILLDALAHLGRPGGHSSYLRLSTRPVDQSLAAIPLDPAARSRRLAQVLAGAYLLRGADSPIARISAVGAAVPNALLAADRLRELGIDVEVVCVTSADRLFAGLLSRQGRGEAPSWILDQIFPETNRLPLVTVADGHPHALSFLASLGRVRHVALGVTNFGQSSDLEAAHRLHGIDADAIVRAALDLVDSDASPLRGAARAPRTAGATSGACATDRE